MKLIFSFLTLCLSLSFLLLQSESYSNSAVKSDSTLSIVREENALISITYGNDRKFTIKNNNYEPIEIVSLEILNEPDHKILSNGGFNSQLMPNELKDFTITGDPKKFTGEVIKIKVIWEDGNAEIKSTIPDLNGKD